MIKTIFHEDLDFIERIRKKMGSASAGTILTDFLYPWEISLARHALKGSKLEIDEWGGYVGALRKRLVASRGNIQQSMFQISCIEFKPSNLLAWRNRSMVLDSFAGHGTGREKIGDIIQGKESYFIYINAASELSSFDDITIERVQDAPIEGSNKPQEDVTATVASVRLDSACAVAFKPSREKIQGLIENGGAMVNYEFASKPGKDIHEGDIISLRGFPRFRICQTGTITKKGRIMVKIEFFE